MNGKAAAPTGSRPSAFADRSPGSAFSDARTLPITLARVTGNLDIVCCSDGTFLGFHGRELPLPSGWRSWNAISGDGRIVASMTVATGSRDHVDWEEAAYDGPFFLGGSDGMLAVLHCVYIVPALRSKGLFQRYEELLAGLGLPVYATFANDRLRARFSRLHQPLVPAG